MLAEARALGGRHVATRGCCCSDSKRAQREADRAHPFGYGRDRYFYSFIVALLLFSLGSVFALYEGIHKLTAGSEDLTSPIVAVAILVVAIGLETYSFRTAIKESRELKGDAVVVGLHPHLGQPGAAGRAARGRRRASSGWSWPSSGVGLSVLTGNLVFDALGTICIGVLLGVIAVILIIETKSLLIGEGASPPLVSTRSPASWSAGPSQRVIHIAHPVHRARRSCWSRPRSRSIVVCRPRRSPRRSTTPRRACATRCPRPG